jgi:hypothetical protein
MIAKTQSKQYFLNIAIELGVYKTANFQHLLQCGNGQRYEK